MAEATMSTVFPMQSDKISGYTPGGYPIGDRAVSGRDLADIDREVYRDGIISTADGSGAYYQVTAGGGMNLNVYAGKCYIRGHKASTPENTFVSVEAADALTNRVDRAVLRLDLSNEVRDVVIAVKKGDATLTRTSSVWELGLADVLVRKATESISQSDITDLRFDPNICGRAYNELLHVDTTGIFSQMQTAVAEQTDKWQRQTDSQQADWQQQTDNQQTDFLSRMNTVDGWYSSVKQDIAKLGSFHFDNLAALADVVRETVLDAQVITETITNLYTGVKIADRITTFIDDSTLTEVTTVYDTDGTGILKQATNSISLASGKITEHSVGF